MSPDFEKEERRLMLLILCVNLTGLAMGVEALMIMILWLEDGDIVPSTKGMAAILLIWLAVIPLLLRDILIEGPSSLNAIPRGRLGATKHHAKNRNASRNP